jgi:hypothetical protein
MPKTSKSRFQEEGEEDQEELADFQEQKPIDAKTIARFVRDGVLAALRDPTVVAALASTLVPMLSSMAIKKSHKSTKEDDVDDEDSDVDDSARIAAKHMVQELMDSTTVRTCFQCQ